MTDGAGYRIVAGRADVDAWQFEDRVRAAPDLAWPRRAEQLQAALAGWRGPALAEFAGRPWATGEAARLTELRLTAVELLAEARVRQGRALHADGRPEDALTLLRQGRLRLRDESGLDPTPRLADLEQVLLAADRAGRPDLAGPAGRSAGPGGQLWRESTAGMAAAGPRSLLTASAQLLGQLALTDAAGLTLAQTRRAAAAEELDGEHDPELAAQLLTRVEVPGIWATADDPAQSAQVVAAARTVLDRLGPETSPALRARLLALIGIESRGTRGPAGPDAARQSEKLARELGDPAVLMPTLNARFLQSFHAVGRRQERAAVGAELIALSRRHDRSTYEILGHLVALQAAAAAGDVITADEHSAAPTGSAPVTSGTWSGCSPPGTARCARC
jgi:hypothetical protein